MKIPTKVPEHGYYYHYKHNPEGEVNNYAYEVIGVGCHTEEDCRDEDANMVVYRPLYKEAFVYKAGKLFDLRPLEMWMGEVKTKNGAVSRFSRIIDEAVVKKLDSIKNELY